MSAAVDTLETRPTERREGRETDPVKVRCWSCETEGVVERDVALCHPCGRWFEVAFPEEGEEER